MNPDNRLTTSNAPLAGRTKNPYPARPVGDVLQGAAADCNSAHKIIFPKIFNAVSRICLADKTPDKPKNASGTLTTGWWLIPAAVIIAAQAQIAKAVL